jgi:hypothetical protein
MSEVSNLAPPVPSKKKRKRKPLSARFRPRRPLRKRLGKLSADDSLAAINYAVRLLGQLLLDIDNDPNLKPTARRAEFVRVAVAMARLRDQDRIFRAEQTVRERVARVKDRRPDGPALVEAPDAAKTGIVARRGKPPKTGLR